MWFLVLINFIFVFLVALQLQLQLQMIHPFDERVKEGHRIAPSAHGHHHRNKDATTCVGGSGSTSHERHHPVPNGLGEFG